MLFRHTQLRRIPFARLPHATRLNSGGINYNKGALSEADLGDSFTHPKAYRSKHHITARLKSQRKIAMLRHEAAAHKQAMELQLDQQREHALRNGVVTPHTPLEQSFVRHEDTQ
uniref:Uncharacterized protein n=1 Tax=Lygus hesperus TaxID=30085 RepID=A0A146LT40_LYGHE